MTVRPGAFASLYRPRMNLTEAMDLNEQLATALARLDEVRQVRDRSRWLSPTRRRLDRRAHAISRQIRRIVARVQYAP
jgi:hypothetical protein